MLLCGPALIRTPSPAGAAPGGAGPAFGDAGVVRTPLRPSSEDFATALAMGPDNLLILAAGAGGDFGFARFTTSIDDVGGTFRESRTTTDFGGTLDVPRAVAATASGDGFVLAGSAGGDMALARYDRVGVLDRSFDGDGRVTLDLGGADDSAYAVVPLPDGRVVAVGGTQATATVAQFLPDGRLDPSFGTSGRVTLASSGPGRAAALQADGKLLVAGGGDALAVYRLLGTGELDPTFGAGGVASVDLGGPARANAMVLAPDRTITVAGSRGPDVAVARFTTLGRPDPTFGTAGVVITTVAGGGAGYGLARRPDGGLLVVGDAGDRGLLARYGPNGTAETGFGTNGVLVIKPGVGDQVNRLRAAMANPQDGWIVAGAIGSDGYVSRISEPKDRLVFGNSVDFGAPRQQVTASVVQPDGKVVALVGAGGGSALVRYFRDGTRDGGFGVAGIVLSDRVVNPRALAVQPNGRILVGGWSGGWLEQHATIAGFRPDGSTDTGFGHDGVAVVDLQGDTTLSALAVVGDGRILMTGYGSADGTLVRFTADGALDPTFGQGGYASASFSGYPGGAARLIVQGDGNVLALGPGPNIYRITPGGTVERGFGAGGKVTFESWRLSQPGDVAIQPDGRILVAGVTSDDGDENITVLRLLPGGAIDPTWKVSPAHYNVFNQGTWAHGTATTLTVQPDGKVLVGGTAVSDVALTRFNPDGTPDRTLGVEGLLLLDVNPGGAPVLVIPTATAGTLVVTTDGSAAFPTAGVLLVRIATGPLGAPTAVTAVAGSGSARVRWARPPAFDESPALAYRVRASDGIHTATTTDGADFTAVVRGLTPGRSYTFTVEAVRGAGSGPASAPSNPVTATMAGSTTAWGWNGATNLGDGTAVDRHHPLTGAGVPGAVALAGGAWHSLAVRADGTVWAWGSNSNGQLGDGTTVNRPTAVQVKGLTNVVAVSAGAFHSVALKADGTVWAWGWNGVGQLGTGSTVDAVIPVQVPGLTGVRSIAAGLFHTLALGTDGTVAAWGWNILGQLGDGTTSDRWLPKKVPGLSGVTAVAAGALHSLALVDDGTMRAWGWNGVSQLGTYDQVDRWSPARVMSVTDVVAIAAGAHHNYALTKDGKVRSWGWNEFGQLGNPSSTAANGILEVWYLDHVASIAAGWFHGLAIRDDGTVVTWGLNAYGQLGDGTTVSRDRFAPILGPLAMTVAGGALHSLAA